MIKSLLAVLALLACAAPSWACRCAPYGKNYRETVENHLNAAAKHVAPDLYIVEVEVIDKRDNGPRGPGNPGPTMRVLVQKTQLNPGPNVLNGNVFIVAGQDGFNCNEALSHFQPGRRYRLALRKGRNFDFDLSNCGVYWEPVLPDKPTAPPGPIKNRPQP